jgi:hypothetical protein
MEAHMRRTAVLILLVMVSACAKPRPALAPERRTFTDVPAEPAEFTEKESEMDITIPAFNPLTGAGVADQIKARFRGTDRGTPKTTMVQASRKKFDSVASLAASLPSDDAMRNHTPALKRDSMFRAVEEQRNVRVPARIYAMKYEADSDWHVILGTDPNGGAKTFFNAEVSGLPGSTAAAFATLQKVRTRRTHAAHPDAASMPSRAPARRRATPGWRRLTAPGRHESFSPRPNRRSLSAEIAGPRQ